MFDLGAPKRRKMREFLMIGHPRMGSGYLSKVLTAAGISIGHERVKNDGMCSWHASVPSFSYPYGQKDAALHFKFSRVFLFVRDPFKALPSLILENRSRKSFQFRREFVNCITGVDLGTYTNEIDRAIASVLYWYAICNLRDIEGFVKIDCKESISLFLANLGVTDKKDIGNALAVPPSNTAESKWPGLEKPVVTDDEFYSSDPFLRENFIEWANAYGYSPNFAG